MKGDDFVQKHKQGRAGGEPHPWQKSCELVVLMPRENIREFSIKYALSLAVQHGLK